MEQNDRGAIIYRNTGEIGPSIMITDSVFQNNGYHLFGNISTTTRAVQLHFHNTLVIFFLILAFFNKWNEFSKKLRLMVFWNLQYTYLIIFCKMSLICMSAKRGRCPLGVVRAQNSLCMSLSKSASKSYWNKTAFGADATDQGSNFIY